MWSMKCFLRMLQNTLSWMIPRTSTMGQWLTAKGKNTTNTDTA